MNLFPLTDCCTLLGVDPKTLRTWLKDAQMSLQAHPSDSRIKCVTNEQLLQLSALHARSLVPPEQGAGLPQPGSVATEVQTRLAQMETQTAHLQQQVAQLALQLLQERTQSYEQRLSNLEIYLQQTEGQLLKGRLAPYYEEKPAYVQRRPHPGEINARMRLLPLVEYEADGTYLLLCPEEGELPFVPDSPQWFEWLESHNAFRFVGKEGRFTAHRNGTRRHPTRTWCAHRYIHPQKHKLYLGVTNAVTLACLERVAAQIQSYVNPL